MLVTRIAVCFITHFSRFRRSAAAMWVVFGTELIEFPPCSAGRGAPHSRAGATESSKPQRYPLRLGSLMRTRTSVAVCFSGMGKALP